jgi:hypothetical protein
MENAAQAGGFFRNFFTLSNLFLKWRGVIPITLIVVLLTSITGIVESVQDRSLMPFVVGAGGRLINHDTNLYIQSAKMEKLGGIEVIVDDSAGFWAKVKAFWNGAGTVMLVIVNLWYLYTFGFVFYHVAAVITNSKDAISSNTALAIIFLVFLQIFANFVIIDKDAMYGYEFTTREKLIPFKGFFKFVSVANYLGTPVYKSTADPRFDFRNYLGTPIATGNVTQVNSTPSAVVVEDNSNVVVF